MVAVLHILLNKLNGGLYDAFEYYSALKAIDSNVKLFYLTTNTSINKKYIIKSFKDRYINNKDIENIVYIPLNKIINYTFNKVLIVDNHTPRKINLIRSNQIYMLIESTDSEEDYKFYNNLYNKYNCLFYNEFKFTNFCVNYKFKFNFNIYKQIYNIDNTNVLYNSNSKGLPSKDDLQILKTYLNKNQILYIICKTFDNYKYLECDNVKFISEHPKNFFNLFSTVLYYHFGKRFDPRPRIFHECRYYGKNAIYINTHNIKDGSYYRFEDAYINNDLSDRFLTKEDIVIRNILS